MGPILYGIVWGTIIAGIYLKTKNPVYTGVIGIVIMMIMSPVIINSPHLAGIMEKALLLMVLGVGSSLFLVFKRKGDPV